MAYNFFLFGLQAGWQSFYNPGVHQLFSIIVIINLVLMVFNLIPLGPLDGHYILPYLLPPRLADLYEELNGQYGNLLFLGLIGLSIAGFPIFRFVFNVGQSLLPYITFV